MSDKPAKFDPEAFVREAYAIAERMDLEGFKALFAADGVFIDESVKTTYTGPQGWDYPVRNYGTAFHDMHRELYDFWTVGNTVFVRLALQGTHYRASSNAVWNHLGNGEEDGRSVRRYLGVGKRQD